MRRRLKHAACAQGSPVALLNGLVVMEEEEKILRAYEEADVLDGLECFFRP